MKEVGTIVILGLVGVVFSIHVPAFRLKLEGKLNFHMVRSTRSRHRRQVVVGILAPFLPRQYLSFPKIMHFMTGLWCSFTPILGHEIQHLGAE